MSKGKGKETMEEQWDNLLSRLEALETENRRLKAEAGARSEVQALRLEALETDNRRLKVEVQKLENEQVQLVAELERTRLVVRTQSAQVAELQVLVARGEAV
jgi:hypothetical protein